MMELGFDLLWHVAVWRACVTVLLEPGMYQTCMCSFAERECGLVRIRSDKLFVGPRCCKG